MKFGLFRRNSNKSYSFLVKREDYSSEEEYEKAYKQMLEDIKEHNMNHPKFKYNPNYREDFIKSVSGLRIENEEDNLP